ncbi:YitT family protein [Candidatus Phytoplasma fabacearum]|uniref:YitT family protein n=1 Tax=Candidatus Phytoplasma fabacearum TaxID=2982628 RepID=A0ABU8ZS78_9MOLU|nr:YitT family protein ['Bituminaria bituminosa' little leaf phytoplasma]MDV3148824.1 YitT family protein [Pigeon pea little leaf phytoplasma]MDO7983533.1 YitT family protein ['Bituminaria bituminosa' little leaf phytoplasma]MDO8023905.1 YitT family protein ['Bituminaria bituminosa' little leaf phytoplasma]MDO8030661.1 YitT family protein ['Bituminaria bituminosa' little leaf phytoplasma]MDV3154047.1 YitT family protein [Pigeon pea little leaf phytoplasma]
MIKKEENTNILSQNKKINFNFILINIFLCFFYCLADILFVSGNYKINLYVTGVHGIGDAIAKVLKSNFTIFKQNPLFVGVFAAFFYLLVNFILFIFIAFPKLDIKFNITTLFNTIFIFLFLTILTILVNGNNGLVWNKMQNVFGLFDYEGKFWFSNLLRVFMVSLITGVIGGICIRIGGSTGGIDIISKYLYIYKKKDISLITCIFNYFISIIATFLIYATTQEFYWESIFLTNLVKIPLTTFFMYLII